jgi:hypothetical protein
MHSSFGILPKNARLECTWRPIQGVAVPGGIALGFGLGRLRRQFQ